MQYFDIAIIGGGLVGSVFARAIHNLGCKVAIIDKAPAAALYASNLDNRGIALSLTSVQNLKNLQLWQQIEPYAHPINTVHISEQGAFGFTKLTAKQYKIPTLGSVVSASTLGRVLLSNLEQCNNLEVLRPQEISNARFLTEQNIWELTLNGEIIYSKMLVAADGVNSFIRQVVGVGCNSEDFAQTAIVTNVHLDKAHTNTAFERFVPNAVLALLPFGPKLLKCVLTVDNIKLAELLNLSGLEFLEYIQTSIGFRAGKFTAIDARLTFPITFSTIDKLYTQNVFFIGNAANTLHPVAAQGFNLGIRDAMTLANLIRQNLNAEAAVIGDLYITERQIDQMQTIGLSSNSVYMFATNNPLIKAVRRFGIMASEFCPGIKNKIITQGLGVWM